ncbi:MAG: VCBS repeat-containing protein [Rhodobacteraceae bacterium]|nr:VCBS repeat-containing protein [Paracoccaceae bacterium]
MPKFACCLTALALLVCGAYPGRADSDINHTTDRHLRQEIMCRIATTPGLKPRFRELDNLRVGYINNAYADLDHDGRPEFISGFSDETFTNDRDPLFKEGNYERSREISQYMFFSPNPDFEVPKGTRFLMARTILVQDFNNDGRHDVVFVQSGPDRPPYEPRRNEIMLSGPGGYKVRYLPGPKSVFHGGAAGDLDNDGDIDVVATPGPRDRVLAYINDGKGHFSPKTLFRNIGRNANVKLWDFDGDGYLDLFTDGRKQPLTVYWGSRNGFSKRNSVEIDGFDQHEIDVMQDMAFGHFTSNSPQAAVLSSYKSDLPNSNNHSGFSIDLIDFENGSIRKSGNVDRAEHPKGYNHWLPWFSACDLKDDGNLDLVFEQHGEHWYQYIRRGALNWSRIDKVLWINDGRQFERVLIEDPIYFRSNFKDALVQFAREHGVTLEKYGATKVYFRSSNGALVFYGDGFGDEQDGARWKFTNYPLMLCETSTTRTHRQCSEAD